MVSYIVGSLVLVLCISTSLAQNPFDFAWHPSSIPVKENGVGVQATFGYLSGAWPYNNAVFFCKLSYSSKILKIKFAGVLFPLSAQFSLDKILTKHTFEVFGLDDKVCHDVKHTVMVKCKLFKTIPVDIKVTQPKLGVVVKDTEPPGACDDPHLTQRVNGIDENGESVTKQVCYDLYGKSGDRLELMSDSLLRTSIVFELRDDYYIGKAFYSTKLGIFNFTTTKISLPSLQMKKWGLEDNFVIGNRNTYPHAVVKQSNNDVLIDYIEDNRSQTIRIVKIQQSYGKSYLNVLVEKSASRNGVFDENHGGIFGLIANQKYEFYEPVQDEGGVAVVRINGRFVKSFLKGSPNETDRCYTMSLEDLTFPKNASSFQKSL